MSSTLRTIVDTLFPTVFEISELLIKAPKFEVLDNKYSLSPCICCVSYKASSNLDRKGLIGRKSQSLFLKNGVETCFTECGITATSEGWYLYLVQLTQDPSANGLRHIGFSIDSIATRNDWIEYCNPSLNGDYNKIVTLHCINLNKSQTIYPWSHQNSGEDLSTTLKCCLIKI